MTMALLKLRIYFLLLPLIALSLFLPRVAADTRAASASRQAGLFGDWKSTAGSIVRVEPCGAHVCLSLVQLIHTHGITTDARNLDPALRARPLCGLRIGVGFTLVDPAHATGGTLYDPENGKTFRGSISLRDGSLHLRGYVGIRIFGASQIWSRPTQPVVPCAAAKP
jgi:uncharacterized protein (DUF2147 family)